jgi:hypothetical protein
VEYERECSILMIQVKFVRATDSRGLVTSVLLMMWFALWIVVLCIFLGIVPFVVLYNYKFNSFSILEYKHFLITLRSVILLWHKYLYIPQEKVCLVVQLQKRSTRSFMCSAGKLFSCKLCYGEYREVKTHTAT